MNYSDKTHTGAIIKKHAKAILIVAPDGLYRLYADVNKRRPVTYHGKHQAMRNYRRAIQGHAIGHICSCSRCHLATLKSNSGYGVRHITATARQAQQVTYSKEAQRFE